MLTILANRLNHLKKNWLSCLVCVVLFAGWYYSIGIPLLSFQIFIVILAIFFTFASCDLSYTNYKNVRKKRSKRSQQISMFSSCFGFTLVFIIMVCTDALHTDLLHYLAYFCITALWLFLLFCAANKDE